MEKVNEQANSSSSENEMSVKILKEVIDQQFLNDNLYISKKTIIVPQYELEINKSNKKSLRISLKEDKFTNLGITTSFQNFIAKKLDKILEGSIELRNNKIIQHCTGQKQKRKKNSGIKLLSTSKKFLVITESREIYTEDKKKSKKCKNYHQFAEDKNALLKLQEAAVDPESIMNKSNTKTWINKRPEPEFKYKRLKNDTLIEV
ncbi:uncharacterized protein [Linepithema humile]|uniref:uncharacterized protein isoform X2 n=1 Tax=Linepithema humile TaxID=83485 RepID=UPI0006230127|nr:PREDICTED: uncharacterized protein LOC105669617 isoform X2 [Linepithema humile]